MNLDDQDEHLPSPPEESTGEAPKLTIPFEDPIKEFFTGLFETMKLILFQPTHFFRNYRIDGPIERPALFAVMVGWTAVVINAIWDTLVNQKIFNYLQEHMSEVEDVDWDKLNNNGGPMEFVFSLILAPMLILLGLFITAGIYHLFLTIVKGANKNFKTTFNVVAYSMISNIWCIIPFCGILISGIVGLVLIIIGLTEAHKTEMGKAAIVVLVPLLLCCCFFFLVFYSTMGGGGLANLLNKNF